MQKDSHSLERAILQPGENLFQFKLGREREKSASYYTPEVLTKCLVKYTLKELLEGKTADEILDRPAPPRF